MTEQNPESDGRSDHPHTYRCPVCSHVDSVVVGSDGSTQITCSHCGTGLVVRVLARDRERVEVQIAGESGRGGESRT